MGVLCLSAVAVQAVQQEFSVTRLGDKAALFRIGREYTTNVVVLASRRGLVVIDTGVLPSRAAALRAAIEREFGRKDFAYVINTHSHFDHVDGNQAFADVPIIAHRNAAREMAASYQTSRAIEAFLRNCQRRQAGLQTELSAAAEGSLEAARIQEEMAENGALMADFGQGRFVLTTPTVLFDDRLSFDLGDLKLNLIYFGRAHTDSDILVHIPELKLLLVGDLFAKEWMPSFQGRRSEVPRWFQALDSLPTGAQAVETVICGHEEPMTGDELRTQIAYLRDIWEGVAEARRQGATLAETKARFPFEMKYPGVAAVFAPRVNRERHLANVEAAWRLQSEPAAGALESLIAARGLEAAVAEYRKTIAGNERYNVVEADLIALGYRYAQSGRTAEGVAVFELNAEAFPRSWNAWDSLAEGCLLKGDRDRAETLYQKSIELNPDNQNGKNQLRRIRGLNRNEAGETKSPLRFDSGAATGLRGPYLGQTPPGTQPALFAPG
ncbi:MAG: MBL fold metallo-hydrolase, partial [Acidobacteriota bacterium]